MKNKGLIAVVIITPLIAVIILAAILITGNLSNKTTPTPTETASASVETVSTPAATEPSIATEPSATTASEPNTEPTVSVEPTTTTETAEPTAEPTTAQTEPTAEPTTEPTQKPTTEPTTEPTTATTESTEPAHVHVWNNGKVSKSPTYTTEGEKKYTCTVCGETKTESVERLKVTITEDKSYYKNNGLKERSRYIVTLADETTGSVAFLYGCPFRYSLADGRSPTSELVCQESKNLAYMFHAYVKGTDGEWHEVENVDHDELHDFGYNTYIKADSVVSTTGTYEVKIVLDLWYYPMYDEIRPIADRGFGEVDLNAQIVIYTSLNVEPDHSNWTKWN